MMMEIARTMKSGMFDGMGEAIIEVLSAKEDSCAAKSTSAAEAASYQDFNAALKRCSTQRLSPKALS